MFLSAFHLHSPTTTPPSILLHSPLGSSSCPPGRNLLRFTATHSTLYIHIAHIHTHTCQITIMPGELRQNRNFTGLDFKVNIDWIPHCLPLWYSVSRYSAFGMKRDGLAWETLFQRPLLLFWLNINVTLRFWSHTALLYGFDIREQRL